MASMSILDDAIREHLELKRAHGADDAELKKLEDEAFGPPERPGEVDPAAEAPTEFLSAPEAIDAPPAHAASERREPNIADLQEAPEAPAPEAPPEPPADEAQPATEHEAIPEPADERPDPGPNTQERHAIAEQPTEFFDVESAIEAEPEAADAPAPSDDDLLEAEHAEPRLAPVDPLAGIEASAAEAEAAEEPLLEDEEDEDDFFSEQRLSDELNQALATPVEGEPQGGPRVEEPIPPGPHTEETEAHYAEREREEGEVEDDEVAEEEFEETEQPAASHEAKPADHEDVLEETPDFLEDAPEDDDLWFEQRPPKDFDFDD
jgi:hypothetical protein